MWPVVVGLVNYRHGCLNIRDMNTIDVMDMVAESMIGKGLIYCDLIAPWNSWTVIPDVPDLAPVRV